MPTTVNLPHVSIGAYGHICREEEAGALVQRLMSHSARVGELKRELAAEMQRAEIASAELTRRSIAAA